MLNKQGQGKIDWTDWTWNPISGCLHRCPYCYMKRPEKLQPGIMEPKFHPERIEKFKRVRKVKNGDKIFVGSSADMWGSWVPDHWISDVLITTKSRLDVTFQFLTKNPRRYEDFLLWDLKNCWFGTTVDGTPFTRNNIRDLHIAVDHPGVISFVSFEPLLHEINTTHLARDMQLLDWIIIGADSTRGAARPPKEWADRLIDMARAYNVPVWVKDNYGYPEIVKEWPEKNSCKAALAGSAL